MLRLDAIVQHPFSLRAPRSSLLAPRYRLPSSATMLSIAGIMRLLPSV